MNVIISSGLTDKKFISKVLPLSIHENIEKIYVIRKNKIHMDKAINYNPPKFLTDHFSFEIFRFITFLYLLLFKKIDFILALGFIPHGFLAGIMGKIFHKPVIQSFLGNDFLWAHNHPVFFRLVKSARIVITRGSKTKEELMGMGIQEDKIYYPANVVNFENIPVEQQKTTVYDLIFLGTLWPLKRIDILLQALHLVKQKYDYPGFKLAIVGGGDDNLEKSLRETAEELSLTNNVYFLGWQKDIYFFLNQARIFILTSEYEGLPTALIEGLACGLPAIAPDVSNIVTVAIHNYNSLLVPVGDVEGFAEQIHRLLTDAELYERLSKNALKIREEKREEYSLEYTANVWEKILVQLSYSPPGRG